MTVRSLVLRTFGATVVGAVLVYGAVGTTACALATRTEVVPTVDGPAVTTTVTAEGGGVALSVTRLPGGRYVLALSGDGRIALDAFNLSAVRDAIGSGGDVACRGLTMPSTTYETTHIQPEGETSAIVVERNDDGAGVIVKLVGTSELEVSGADLAALRRALRQAQPTADPS